MVSAVLLMVGLASAPSSAPPVTPEPVAGAPFAPAERRRSAEAPRVRAPWLGLKSKRGDEAIDLRPLPGGGFEYTDEVGGFVATIQPDGSVDFEPLLQAKLQGTPKTASGWLGGFVDALQQPAGQRGRSLGSKDDPDEFTRDAAGGMETVNWGPYGPGPMMIGFGSSFGGLTGASRGPSQKAQREFLNKTEAMRDSMAVRFRKKQLDKAARRITRDVVAIWKSRSTPLSIRKRQVFELWADAQPPQDNEGPLATALEEGSRDVRLRIEKAVRMLAPKGSDDAYTDEELSELNAGRTGDERFDPYATSSAESR